MIPTTKSQSSQRAYDISDNIVEIKFPTVRQKTLEELGPNSKYARANKQCEVEVASSRGVEDPVETGGKDEESNEVKYFVVDDRIDLES